jgi:hypothetical protein
MAKLSQDIFSGDPIRGGYGVKLRKVHNQIIISARGGVEKLRHPWFHSVIATVPQLDDAGNQVMTRPVGFEEGDSLIPGWETHVTVLPGFVNSRPAYIAMDAKWFKGLTQDQLKGLGNDPTTGQPYDPYKRQYVSLCATPKPYLVITGWEDPTAMQLVATDSGDLAYKAPEGYPAFFSNKGVVPLGKGGPMDDPKSLAPDDPTRTRLIRKSDTQVGIPRIGSHIEEVDAPDGSQQYQNVNDIAYYRSTKGHSHVDVGYAPIPKPTFEGMFGLEIPGGEASMMTVKLATVWMVSPANPPYSNEEAVVDSSWTPYVQHTSFWNIFYAIQRASAIWTRPSDDPLAGLGFLGAGTLGPILQAYKAWSDSMYNELTAFLDMAMAQQDPTLWNI